MPERLEFLLPAEADPEAWDDARWLLEVSTMLAQDAAQAAGGDGGDADAADAAPAAADPGDARALIAARPQRISFDARVRHMKWRIALDLWREGEEVPEPPRATPLPPAELAEDAPTAVVIGAGPAGLFCALELLRRGMRPIVLERGEDARTRRRAVAQLNRGAETNPESNYAFGEGGAGTYSDGKLYTRSHKRGDVHGVLETLVAHGAPASILVSWRPHIGSNRLPEVVQALRASILAGGGEVRFGARVDALLTEGGEAAHAEGTGAEGAEQRVRGVRLASGDEIATEAVVLATGHSALDALHMARAAGARLEPKGFAVGVRVEHPQSWLDEVQYHGQREEAGLPASFYELSAQCDERGVYSFCMCPGGWIVPSQSTPGTLVVNGMSLAKRDSPYANSGVVVELQPKDWCGKRGWRWGWPELMKRAAAASDHPALHEVVEDPRGGAALDVATGRLPVHPEQDPLYGVRLQLALEVLAAKAGGGEGRAPAQRCSDFVGEHGATLPPLPTSYLPGLTAADFDALLPKGVARRLRAGMLEFEERLPSYTGEQGQLVGVETRTSSPVRLPRGRESMQAEGCAGLYPCGEGAGYAGGIVSAALDGLRVAAAAAEALAVR